MAGAIAELTAHGRHTRGAMTDRAPAPVLIDAPDRPLAPGAGRLRVELVEGRSSATVITAHAPMKLLVLSRHDFNEMLSNAMPHIAPKLMQVMGNRIRELSIRHGDPLPY